MVLATRGGGRRVAEWRRPRPEKLAYGGQGLTAEEHALLEEVMPDGGLSTGGQSWGPPPESQQSSYDDVVQEWAGGE